jgi:phosphoribosylanthranilate isomerase
MPTPLERFLDPSFTSLKVCGVTRPGDAAQLVRLGVDAIGVNFWPRSKRFLDPQQAAWLAELAGRILRVAVTVNADPEPLIELFQKGWIDAVQLHGDETPDGARVYRERGVPLIKALGVPAEGGLDQADEYGAAAVLLDTHAPGVYGGTGESFDWKRAVDFIHSHPGLPLILAGGIVPENAALAVAQVRPVAIDVASGAESSPGIKDFTKVSALLAALHS